MTSPRAEPPGQADLLQPVRGAIHLHSRYSDGSDTVLQIVDAARAAGLHYVVVTDHDSMGAAEDGLAGWHDGVLLIVGCEVSPTSKEDFLAVGARRLTPYDRATPTAELMDQARRDGAHIYIAHPQGLAGRRKPTVAEPLPQWRHWDSSLYDGMEIWSYMHDVLCDWRVWTLPGAIRRPEARVRGPEPRVLQRWDELNQQRRVVGLGASDNHAMRIPLTPWRILPHESTFRAFTTYVLVPPFTGDAPQDTRTLLDAVAAGRTWPAFTHLAPADALRFELLRPDGPPLPMGSEVPHADGLRLVVELPRPATARIMRDGVEWQRFNTASWAGELSGPGVYRLEARIDGRPWLFTNPFLIRAGVAP